MRVDTYDLVLEGVSLLERSDSARVTEYFQRLRRDDPLAWAILDVAAATLHRRLPEAAKKGTRLLSRVSGDLRLSEFLFNMLGMVYTKIGELSSAENYFIRALEIAQKIGETKHIAIIKLNLLNDMLFRAKYEPLRKEIEKFDLEIIPSARNNLNYMLAIIEMVRGKPETAIKRLEFLDESDLPKLRWRHGMEIKGLALRLTDKLDEAMICLLASAQGFVDFSDAYAPFPCAKALQLSRFAGLEPPPMKLIRRCLALARKGSWGEQAAAQEIEALLYEDDSGAARGLFAAAQSYQKANQPLEACLTGSAAAFLAWKTTDPVFPAALKFLAPLVPLHPGFKKDPILGDFLARIEPLLEPITRSENTSGIRAYLIGELRVFVNGERVSLKRWRNNKAIMALLYLLLSPHHRIPRDHLFYLLWPKRSYASERSRVIFYKAIYLVRRNLRNPELLTKNHDFYQLEGEVWTDLGEIENLVRLADTTRVPDEKEEFLARARELAKSELLPEFPYDRHIDEYRQYYERLRRRVFADR